MSCLSPFSIKNPKKLRVEDPYYIPVPCGKCPNCLKRKSNDWAFRLNQEEKRSSGALFVTLTYENPPMSPNGFMTLQKADFQLFMKRLRKAHGKHKTIKYWACGEYGSASQRPHYHAIMFNVKATDEDFTIIQESWGLGHVHVGSVTAASINYTTKYLHKGNRVPIHPRDDREPEKSMSSKFLGANYMTDDMIDYHKNDLTRSYVTHPEGFKSPLPRYFRDKIYTDDEKKVQREFTLALIQIKEVKDKQKFIQRTGSLQGYERSKHESKKAIFDNYSRKQNENRRKI